MAKEWILNSATNRWQLNYKRNVGPTSKWIRECEPQIEEEWEACYLEHLGNYLAGQGIMFSPNEHLENLGQRLYAKVSEVVAKEIEEVTEEDCIAYIRNLVINRTFQGYVREQETVYGRLEKVLGVPIHPAPDEWDRGYNVDFYIELGPYYMGLQIKPVTFEQMPDVHKWAAWQKETHEKFQEKYGGRVFMVFSVKKEIQNEDELVDEIEGELNRLRSLVSED